jgi:hypothetical protein
MLSMLTIAGHVHVPVPMLKLQLEMDEVVELARVLVAMRE